MIIHDGKEWRTLEHKIYHHKKQIIAVYRNGRRYYPQDRFTRGTRLGNCYFYTAGFVISTHEGATWTKDNDAPCLAAIFACITDQYLNPVSRALTAVGEYKVTGVVAVSTQPEYVSYSGNVFIGNIGTFSCPQSSDGRIDGQGEAGTAYDTLSYGGTTLYVSRLAAPDPYDDFRSFLRGYDGTKTYSGGGVSYHWHSNFGQRDYSCAGTELKINEPNFYYDCKGRDCTAPAQDLLASISPPEMEAFLEEVLKWEIDHGIRDKDGNLIENPENGDEGG